MGNKVSLIKVLFPLPETPVMAIKQPSGISISMDFKLLPCAPFKESRLPCPFLRVFGIFICLFPDKYFPVRDLFDLYNSFGTPEKVTIPPFLPAPGPKSIT